MNLNTKNVAHDISLLLMASSSVSGYADTMPLSDSGLMIRENRKVPEQPQQQSDVSIEKPELARPAMLPKNDLRITVKNFQLADNAQFSNAELETFWLC